MNLIELKNQVNNKLSNFYFIRDALIKNYFKEVIKVYNYLEILEEYKPSRSERVLITSRDNIIFKSLHIDLAHAKHEALAILDFLEHKIVKDFSISLISGVRNGDVIMLISKSRLYYPLILIKFVKSRKGVELKGKFILNQEIQNILDISSYRNLFKPYLISLFPIQLNDKKVSKYGNQIVKKIKHHLIHDISDINHSDKLNLSAKLNIPFSISYGTKDLEDLTLNVYANNTGEFSRIKFNNLEKIISKVNVFKQGKDLSNTLYSCKDKKCEEAINKLEGILIKPFNQISIDQKCNICNREASVKYISIKVGDSA
jgi:hypothetical protein